VKINVEKIGKKSEKIEKKIRKNNLIKVGKRIKKKIEKYF
jgi:hypothetical protein